LAAVVLAAVAALGLVLFVPGLEHLFGFEAPSVALLLLAAAAGSISVGWFELIKPLRFGG
jgi:hypothetical protein